MNSEKANIKFGPYIIYLYKVMQVHNEVCCSPFHDEY